MLNLMLNRITEELASGTRRYQRIPTAIHMASHAPNGPDALSPTGALPRPGARLFIRALLHEPFEGPTGAEWTVAFEGSVDHTMGFHEVSGLIAPSGPVPEALAGPWRVYLERRQELWMVRSMVRPGE